MPVGLCLLFASATGFNPAAYAALGIQRWSGDGGRGALAGSTDHAAVRAVSYSMVFNSLMGIYRLCDGRQVGKNKYLFQWRGGSRHLSPTDLAPTQLIYR